MLRRLYSTILLLLSTLMFFGADDVGLVNFMRQQAQNSNLDAAQRIAYYDQLLALKPADSRQLLYDKARLYRHKGQLDKSKEIVDSLLKDCRNDPVGLRLNILFDHAYFETKNLNALEAFRGFDEVLRLAKPDSLRYFDINALIFKGRIFSSLERYDIYERFIAKADSVFSAIDSTSMSKDRFSGAKATLLLAHGQMQFSKYEFDKAFNSYSAALAAYPSQGTKVTAYNGLGTLYSLQGNHQTAREYYLKAMDELSEGPDRALIAGNYLITFADTQEYQKMIDEAIRLKDVLNELEGSPQEGKVWAALAEAYDGTGDYLSAYRTLQHAFRCDRAAMSDLNRSGVEHIVYEAEKEQMAASIARLDHLLDMCIWSIVALGLLLIAAVTTILLIRRRLHRREELIADIDRMHSDELGATAVSLEERNRQLATMSINLARLSDIIGAVRRESADADKPKETRLSAIRGLVRDVSVKQDVWEFVKTCFEQANPTFFRRLLTLNPNLTSSELRICAFSLAGMNAKEIANLTSRSIHTIESIRYSVRKKLSIEGSTDVWIKNLAGMSDTEFASMAISRD